MVWGTIVFMIWCDLSHSGLVLFVIMAISYAAYEQHLRLQIDYCDGLGV